MEDTISDSLFIHALIGEEPAFGDGTLAAEALKANAVLRESAGAALCRDVETEKYAAVQRLPLSALDVDSLSAAVDAIVALASHWRERLLGGYTIMVS